MHNLSIWLFKLAQWTTAKKLNTFLQKIEQEQRWTSRNNWGIFGAHWRSNSVRITAYFGFNLRDIFMLQATQTEATARYRPLGYQTGVRVPSSTGPLGLDETFPQLLLQELETTWIRRRFSLCFQSAFVWGLKRGSCGLAALPSACEPGSYGRSESGRRGKQRENSFGEPRKHRN